MIVSALYISAIELLIKDAFPESKVNVFCEASMFFQNKCAVEAYVDEYAARVTLDAFEWNTEELVSEKLISMIKEAMERRMKNERHGANYFSGRLWLRFTRGGVCADCANNRHNKRVEE